MAGGWIPVSGPDRRGRPDLVVATSGCYDRFGAVVQDLGDRVSVELAVAHGRHLSCLMNE